MWEIPTIIDILSQFKHCSKKDKSKGYTDETYHIMITEKIDQLKKLQQEFISSLNVY